jgi:hypothetical protein
MSPEEKEFVSKAQTLELAYQSNLIAGFLLRTQLQAGTVACEDLLRHNVGCSLVHNAQLRIRDHLVQAGGSAPLPPMPVLFFPKGTQRVFFDCPNPKKLVGPSEFDVYLPSNMTAEAFAVKLEVREELGLPVIPLVIAGITVVVAAVVISKAAISASADKELGRLQLDAIKQHAVLSQYVAEARKELVDKCLAAGGGDVRTCAELAQRTIDSAPKDPTKIGQPKFESNWTAWLLGGILVGAVGVVGTAFYVSGKKRGLRSSMLASPTTKLWRWRPGFLEPGTWSQERACDVENAQGWLQRFQSDEPHDVFVLSDKKPTKDPEGRALPRKKVKAMRGPGVDY